MRVYVWLSNENMQGRQERMGTEKDYSTARRKTKNGELAQRGGGRYGLVYKARTTANENVQERRAKMESPGSRVKAEETAYAKEDSTIDSGDGR